MVQTRSQVLREHRNLSMAEMCSGDRPRDVLEVCRSSLACADPVACSTLPLIAYGWSAMVSKGGRNDQATQAPDFPDPSGSLGRGMPTPQGGRLPMPMWTNGLYSQMNIAH